MQDSEELEVLFFKAQDSQDASVRARLFSQITSTVATDDPGRIVSSAAHNSLAELKIDEAMALGFPMTAHDDATVLEARRLLRQALKLWPDNAQAAMSLALLERDCGHADRALELWTAVAALEADEDDDEDDDEEANEWAEAWILEPRRQCVPLAAMYAALLLSQLGRHEQAVPTLRRFGFTRALAPSVWACARTPPRQASATPASATAATVAAAAAAAAAACPVRYFGDALRPETHAQLLAAFAPGAAYWRETGYEQASANKQYFTFGVDVAALRSGARPPPHPLARRGRQTSDAGRAYPTPPHPASSRPIPPPGTRQPADLLESVVLQLLPRLGDAARDLVSAEWWVVGRRNFQPPTPTSASNLSLQPPTSAPTRAHAAQQTASLRPLRPQHLLPPYTARPPTPPALHPSI